MLTDFINTKNKGRKSNNRLADAALLSILPYGAILKNDIRIWFMHPRNVDGKSELIGNASVGIATLLKKGYLAEYSYVVKSHNHNYREIYYTLTRDSIDYLDSKYRLYYPRLRNLSDNLYNNPTIQFRPAHADSTIKLLLSIQSCNIYFHRAHYNTIIDRLRIEPVKALSALKIVAEHKSMANSFLSALVEAMEEWITGKILYPYIPNLWDKEPSQIGEYYDAIEMRVPENNPYIIPEYVCTPEDYKSNDKLANYRSGHKGVLALDGICFVVYRSKRDGASWSASAVQSNFSVLARQLKRLGLADLVPSSNAEFHSIMLVEGLGEGVSAFRRVCVDSLNMRAKNNKALGRGTASLHVIPMTLEGTYFVQLLGKANSGDRRFVSIFLSAILNRWPTLFRKDLVNHAGNLTYKNTLCCFCMDLNIHTLNEYLARYQRKLTASDDVAIGIHHSNFYALCFDWQVPYIRSIFPSHITIVSISKNGERLVEIPPDDLTDVDDTL